MGADFGQLAGLGAILALSVIYALKYLHAPVSPMRSLLKTLPVAGMALLAVWIEAPWLLGLALALSALGDYFLSLEERFFIPGLLAFLAGHVAYIPLFLSLAVAQGHIVLQGFVLLYTVSFGMYLWSRTGKYRLAVMVYIGGIAAMASLSLRLPAGYLLATTGAFIFVLSDSLLAIRMFVLADTSPRKPLFSTLIWISYIAAQLALLIGLGRQGH